MTISRRAAKRDSTEAGIVKALRDVGATVWQVSGKGIPDLTVGYRGQTFLLEVKAPKKGLTPDQEKTHAEWRGGAIHVVETPEQALRAIGLETPRWVGELASVENGLLPAPRRKR